MKLPKNGSIVGFMSRGRNLMLVCHTVKNGQVKLVDRTFFITEDDEEVGLEFKRIMTTPMNGDKFRTLWELERPNRRAVRRNSVER